MRTGLIGLLMVFMMIGMGPSISAVDQSIVSNPKELEVEERLGIEPYAYTSGSFIRLRSSYAVDTGNFPIDLTKDELLDMEFGFVLDTGNVPKGLTIVVNRATKEGDQYFSFQTIPVIAQNISDAFVISYSTDGETFSEEAPDPSQLVSYRLQTTKQIFAPNSLFVTNKLELTSIPTTVNRFISGLSRYRQETPDGVKTWSDFKIMVYRSASVDVHYRDDNGESIVDSSVAKGRDGEQTKINNKAIEGYLYDHYEYKDSTGKKQTGTATSWTGPMNLFQPEVTFYYKKKQPVPELSMTVDKSEADLEERLFYTVNVANTGTEALKEAKIVSHLPEGLSPPKQIMLDGEVIPEGSEQAGEAGSYYTWNDESRELILYLSGIEINAKHQLTYNSVVMSGIEGDVKLNSVELSGENSQETKTGEVKTIVRRLMKLYVKQEIIKPHSGLVIPTTGSVIASHLGQKEGYTMTIPSYETGLTHSFKEVNLESVTDQLNYQLNNVIPAYYSYQGYVLTTEDSSHVASMKQLGVPVLTYDQPITYWVTLYIEPTVSKEGPSFYSWDTRLNSFGSIHWTK